MSRNIEKMDPILRVKFYRFDAAMKEAGLKYMVTNVDRTVLMQMALFVQGRIPVKSVNMFREVAGLGPIAEVENNKVTWTLNSAHVTNMLDDDLKNNFSRAFDIAMLSDGKPHWDIKVDANAAAGPDYDEAGKIAESVGLKWGGRWKKPDRPHIYI